MFASQKSERESYQLLFFWFFAVGLFPALLVLVKCTHEDVTCRLQRVRQREREGIFIGHPPCFFLHGLELIEFVNRAEVANRNLWRRHSHCGPSYSTHSIFVNIGEDVAPRLGGGRDSDR